MLQRVEDATAMSRLNATSVSSNWKKLQATLQAGKQGEDRSSGAKRKRQDEPRKGLKPVKKTKLDDRRPRRPEETVKMGLNGSKEVSAHEALSREHGIAKEDISAAYGQANGIEREHIDEINAGLHPTHKAGKYVALDCEMVGTGPPPHLDHVLARVSLVNFHGEQIYDTFVLPPQNIKVEDYRTFVSGIKPSHLRAGYARPFSEVQKTVSDLLDGRILVGHALGNDMRVLMLSHSKRDMRDTSRHPKFREATMGKPPALKNLAKSELGLEIQKGEHSSVVDARATMMLFKKEKAGFEEDHRQRYGTHTGIVPKAAKQKPAALPVADDQVTRTKSSTKMTI